MADKRTRYMEVGINDSSEVVINYKQGEVDSNGIAHFVFSSNQARNLARLLTKHANEIDALQTTRRLPTDAD